jgi:phage portal protein BeeE
LSISGDTDLTFQRQYVRFSVDGLLRADALSRAQVYEKALDPVTGYMTREEVRELEDLTPETPTTATTNGAGNSNNVEAMIANANN